MKASAAPAWPSPPSNKCPPQPSPAPLFITYT